MSSGLPPTKTVSAAFRAAEVAVMRCTLAYATPSAQWCVELDLPAGATAAQALESAQRLLAADPAQAGSGPMDWANLDCGIFGQACGRGQVLQHGDRLELYRPLQADPRDSRRSRVQAGRRRTRK